MTEPRWLDTELILLLHFEHMALFGGKESVRDAGLLVSATLRASTKWDYGETNVAVLAAAYGSAFTRPPLPRRNKRTGFTALITFLGLDGIASRRTARSYRPEARPCCRRSRRGELAAWFRRVIDAAPAT